MQMIPVRIFFEKTGRAKYTSHLDTMRTMTRAFKRSGLPFWYTQGFNPHLYNTFSLPIALGYESRCESVDLRLTQEVDFSTVLEKVNASLPPGLKAVDIASPVMSASEITWADYRVEMNCPQQRLTVLMNKWITFLEEPAIEVTKKTKKGEKVIDLKPHLQSLSIEESKGWLIVGLRLAAGNTLNINPTLVLEAFWSWSGEVVEQVHILRTHIYDKNLQPFR